MPHYFNNETSDYRESVWPPLDAPWVEVASPPPDPAWLYTFADGQYAERVEADLMPRYRADKLAALNAWYEATLAAGIRVSPTLTIPATTHHQGRLAALGTGIQLALGVGQLTAESQCPSPVWDVAGVAHDLTVAEFIGYSLAYMAGVATVERTWQGYEQAIQAATTKAELDAIVIGE